LAGYSFAPRFNNESPFLIAKLQLFADPLVFSMSYGVDVSPGEDDVLILVSSVVIDLCCYPDHKGRLTP
jgi:hypothetical protein